MPCGMSTAATVSPANKSPRKSANWYLQTVSRGGREIPNFGSHVLMGKIPGGAGRMVPAASSGPSVRFASMRALPSLRRRSRSAGAIYRCRKLRKHTSPKRSLRRERLPSHFFLSSGPGVVAPQMEDRVLIEKLFVNFTVVRNRIAFIVKMINYSHAALGSAVCAG